MNMVIRLLIYSSDCVNGVHTRYDRIIECTHVETRDAARTEEERVVRARNND